MMKNQQEIAAPKNEAFEEQQNEELRNATNDEATSIDDEAKSIIDDNEAFTVEYMPPKEKKRPLWARLLFSGAITNDTKTSKKIAYIAVIAAFLSVSNLFEIKFADIQFSLSIAASALAGIVLGAVFGSAAAFLGDLVGFLFNSGGYPYMPWVGIALAVNALLAGILVGGIRLKFKGALFVKIAFLAICSFLICTVGINTTAFWILYSKDVPYVAYAVSRIIVKGQIFNCLVNYAFLYITIPIIDKLKVVNFNY